MTTRGEINSNFYQIVNVDANGAPTSIDPAYIQGGNATNANYANYAGNAFSVSVGNVVGIGNIATIDLSGNGQQVLLGNGAWGDGGNATNANYANFAGTVITNAQPNITSVGTLTSLNVSGNVSTPTVYNNGMQMQGFDYVQMQYSNAVTLPVSPYDIGVGSWFYLDAGGAVWQSNTTGTLKTVILGNNGNINADGNVTAPYFIGNVNANNLTVSNTANLGSVSNVTITGGVNGYVLQTDGTGVLSWTAQTGGGGGGTPGGANTQVQYNDSGNFGGAANFTFNSVTSLLTLTGNINATYFNGNGSGLTSITGANVSGYVANATHANIADSANSVAGSNVSGQVANALIAGTVYTADQPNITSVGTLLNLAVTGNISASNIQATTSITTVDLTATGNVNITGNINQISGNSGQFFGNATTGFGALYAGVPTGYSNVPQTVLQVAGNYNGYIDINLQNINSGSDASTDISVLADNGNSLNYFIDMGITSTTYDSAGLFTSLDHNDGYVYVVGGDTSGTHGNLILGSITPNAQVKFIVGGANIADIAAIVRQPNTNSTNNTSGTITIAGGLGITGNIYGGNLINANYFSGNGSLLTGITSTTGNANYANFAGNVVNASQSNITSLGTLTSLNVTGNITAGNVNAGNLLTANYSTAVLTTGAQPNITSVGTLTGLNVNDGVNAVSFTSNVATGTAPFTVTSTTQVANLTVAFANIANVANSVAGGNVSGQVANALVAGTVYTNAQPNITSTGTLTSLAVTGNVSANIFTSNVATGNAPFIVTSTTQVANLTVAFANVANTANAVAGANVSGQVGNALVAGTVYTNAQPNITSVGSLTGLTVSNATGVVNFTTTANVSLGAIGNLKITGGSASQYLQTDGAGNLSFATISSGSSIISNGTSNVSIPASSGNVNINVNGTGIATFTSSNLNVNGNIIGSNSLGIYGNGGAMTGNITVTNYYSSTSYNLGFAQARGTRGSPTAITAGDPIVNFTGIAYTGNGTTTWDGVSGWKTVTPFLSTVTAQPTGANGYFGSNVRLQSSNATANTNYIYTFDDTGGLSIPGNLSVTGTSSPGNLLTVKYNETVVAGGSVSGTLTPNAAAGTIYNYTLTGNITLSALTNAVAGTGMTIILTQDGTGNRTLTSTMKFLGGSKTLSTAASSIDIMSVFYDGTTYYASLGKGFA